MALGCRLGKKTLHSITLNTRSLASALSLSEQTLHVVHLGHVWAGGCASPFRANLTRHTPWTRVGLVGALSLAELTLHVIHLGHVCA